DRERPRRQRTRARHRPRVDERQPRGRGEVARLVARAAHLADRAGDRPGRLARVVDGELPLDAGRGRGAARGRRAADGRGSHAAPRGPGRPRPPRRREHGRRLPEARRRDGAPVARRSRGDAPGPGGAVAMRWLFWGAGAIGGTVAAHAIRAGHDVVLVDANAAHVEAIRARGLRITGPLAEFTVPATALTPDEVTGEWRAVLLCTKAHHT